MNKYIVSAVLWVKRLCECQAQIGVEVDGEQKASIISELTVQVINVAGMYLHIYVSNIKFEHNVFIMNTFYQF